MPDAGWVPVANSAAQNHGISWRAKGTASVSQPSENQSSVSQSSDFQSVNRKTETNTETNTKDQTSSDQHSASLASLATAADAAADDDRQNRRLQHAYDVIEGMSPDLRRRHLLTIERRRPKIYRECRNEAIRQLERKDPNALKGTHSALAIDRLSYKWMVQHYAPTWPQWIARLIDDAYRSLDSRA